MNQKPQLMLDQFKCCGVSRNGAKGYTIYKLQNSQNFGNGKPQVPESCCTRPGDQSAVSQCVLTPTDPNLVHQEVSKPCVVFELVNCLTNGHPQDCYVKMKDFVKVSRRLVEPSLS